MVPDHGTQIEENPYTHHGGIQTDGLTDDQTDWTLSYIPQLCLGSVGNNKDTE